MGLYIKEVPIGYHIHNTNQTEKPKCSLCEADIEVKEKRAIPVFLEGEYSYMMLCEKEYNKLIKRNKFKRFYAVLDKIKILYRKVKFAYKKG